MLMYYHENWMPIERGPYTLWPLYKNTGVIQEVVTICPIVSYISAGHKLKQCGLHHQKRYSECSDDVSHIK